MASESLPAPNPCMSPDSSPGLTGGPYLDSLPLRNAVLSPDLVLEERGRRRYLLHAVHGGRASRVGHFTDAASAWRALDEFDDSLAGR